MAEILRFFRDEEGATAVEYGLLVSLIAVAIITTVKAVGVKLSSVFNTVSTNLDFTP